MTNVNPNNGTKKNQTFFERTYSNLTPFFIAHKYFGDFYDWHLSISLQK